MLTVTKLSKSRLLYFFLNRCVCIYVSEKKVYCVCVYECACICMHVFPWRPEEDIKSPNAKATAGSEWPRVEAGK